MNSLDLDKDLKIAPGETTETTKMNLETVVAELPIELTSTTPNNEVKQDLEKGPEIVPSETVETETNLELLVTEQPEEITEKAPDSSELTDTAINTVKVEAETIELNEIIQEVTENAEAKEIKAHSTDLSTSNKAELMEALKLLVGKEVEAAKDEVEHIKQLFYKKTKSEIEEQKKLFVEAGGDENDFVVAKDESEESFKSLMNEFRAKKASVMAQIEKEKENNLLEKQQILEQMKVLGETNDDVSSHINEFRSLQQKWKTIGQVPQSASAELWKQYNNYQELFWDLIKINNELREYDFKKNLESKTLLCEAAEKLIEETDVILAFQKLQKLHEDWHDLGPVARELREQIWTRFKEASTNINKKHQSHFDSIRKLEEENFVTKSALCDKIEAFDFSKFNSYRTWDDATKKVLAWQDEWRAIGFAPRKINQKIFDRYRKACDRFFSAKTEFYKETKNVLSQNYDKKKALCEKAEELKDSTEWKETVDKLIQLQKEWKTIGPIAKKHSDELWKRFITACDYFFEQKNKSTSGQRNQETENLTKKTELIAKIVAFEKTDNPSESLSAFRTLIAEWNTIGHVPFKEKDKIYKEYREAVDQKFELLNVDVSNRRLDSFRSNVKEMGAKGDNKLFREREKLVRAFEHLKSEISTYENNIGFFSSSSKKAGGMIKEMERKIEALKEESRMIEKKINMLEENI